MTIAAMIAAREGYIDTIKYGPKRELYYRFRPYRMDPATGKKARGKAIYLGNDNTRRY